MAETFQVTDRTQLRRKPERGSYDRDVAHAILDEAVVCHIAFNGADGHPVAIPTLFARVERAVRPWQPGQRHAANALWRGADVPHGHPRRWPGAGQVGFPPLDQLSVGRRVRNRDGRERRGHKGPRIRRLRGARGPRSYRRRPPSLRQGAEGHPPASPAARRGLGEDPHRRADRRRGGHELAGLDWCDRHDHRVRRAPDAPLLRVAYARPSRTN